MNIDQIGIFDAVTALLREDRFEEALERLARAREDAFRANDRIAAALFSSTLGSLLSSRERHREALAEFETAEADDPGNPSWKLGTANHLLELGEPQRALHKIDEVMERGPTAEMHLAGSLRGLAFVQQNRIDEALAMLRKLLDSIGGDMPASACDLRLPKALVACGVTDNAVREYVAAVRAKGEEAP